MILKVCACVALLTVACSVGLLTYEAVPVMRSARNTVDAYGVIAGQASQTLWDLKPTLDSVSVIVEAAEKSVPPTLRNVQRITGDSSVVVRQAVKNRPPWYLRWLGLQGKKK